MTAPIRREVLVAAVPERAFALFTDEIGEWWPVSAHSVYEGSVAFEDGRIVERTADGESVWAEVTEWNPPHALTLNWHAGRDEPDPGTDVRVTFEEQDGQTLVTLVHSGWERLADPDGEAREYGNGWPTVLGAYEQLVAAADEEDAWYVLEHTPGPSLPAGTSIFATPEFREHLAFLGRLEDAGLLVAGGPLPDEDGAGMTIVRVRPSHGPVDVVALATTDDLCVAAGFLSVRVRPWQVMVEG